MDRTLLACDAEQVFDTGGVTVDAFVIDVVDGFAGLSITDELRAAGFSADRAFDGRSMKSQMKAADRSGAVFAVIVGSDEADAGTCTVRNLSTSEQLTVPRDGLVAHLAGQLGSRTPRRSNT